MPSLVVPNRFRGPASSGNGGWTAGALALLLAGPPEGGSGAPRAVEVTLRQPPPLDTELPVTVTASTAACDPAQARFLDRPLREVAPVDVAVARAAEATYPGLTSHPFPGCFACGPQRAEGDGLRIFPGTVAADPDGSHRVAATWRPHPSVAGRGDAPGSEPRASVPATWAALDCVGGWSSDLEERPMVLGRMAAAISSLPVIGERHVVVGTLVHTEGRRTFTASALFDASGRAVARAEHVWIAVDPTVFSRSLG